MLNILHSTVSVSVCIGHTVRPAETAEPIKMPIGGPKESCITWGYMWVLSGKYG